MDWQRWVPAVENERGIARLRRGIAVVLVAGLVACAGQAGRGPADPSLLEPGQTLGPTATTIDLDGVEPDAVPPPDPVEVPATALPTSTTRIPLLGFGEVLVQVTRVDGQVVEWCLLLAETSAQTHRGLMEVTDPTLGGYAGMLFRFADDQAGGFYMRNTPQALSLVYLDAEGAVVSIIRMEPCGDVDGCQTYPAAGTFRRTIEVPEGAGGVAALGIEPGAIVADTGRVCA